MMSTPYWSSPMAKLMNWLTSALPELLPGAAVMLAPIIGTAACVLMPVPRRAGTPIAKQFGVGSFTAFRNGTGSLAGTYFPEKLC